MLFKKAYFGSKMRPQNPFLQKNRKKRHFISHVMSFFYNLKVTRFSKDQNFSNLATQLFASYSLNYKFAAILDLLKNYPYEIR